MCVSFDRLTSEQNHCIVLADKVRVKLILLLLNKPLFDVN
jgi:hypothetical protein